MSNDKDLSKPVGVPDKCPGVPAWTFADGVDPRRCYAAGWRAGVNSEYVQSLLVRIESMAQAHIALQQLCEVYRSAYEEARGIVNIPMVEALEKAQRYIEELREWNAGLAQESCERQLRIAELEAIVNTPVNLPSIGGKERYAWSDGVFNYREDVVLALTRHGLAHGLTVQED